MESPSAGTLERRLLTLDHDGFADFVADLWRACGWDVTREGYELEVARQRESKRFLVIPPNRIAPGLRRAPAPEGRIDAVVSPLANADRSTLPRGTPDVPIVDVAGIRERLQYAVDEETRRRLLAEHLGLDGDDDSVGGPWAVLALRVPNSGRASAAVGVFLVLTGLAIVLVATGVPFGDSTSGTANASEPQSAGSITTASADIYDARPTCERGPGEVVAVSANATRGSSLSRGLVVMGGFWNPRHVRAMPDGTWWEMMTTEERVAFYDADSVTFDEPSIDDDEATVVATATIDGEEREYRFGLGRGDRSAGEGCWMIERFGAG